MKQAKIIVDTREQTPLVFSHLPHTVTGLSTGDYSVEGFADDFVVERKSIADLVGSLTSGRDRFLRELVRMRGYRFRRLLIIGARTDIEEGNYRSAATPQSILGSLHAIEIRYGLPVVFVDTPNDASLMIERWVVYFVAEEEKRAERLKKMPDAAKSERTGGKAAFLGVGGIDSGGGGSGAVEGVSRYS